MNISMASLSTPLHTSGLYPERTRKGLGVSPIQYDLWPQCAWRSKVIPDCEARLAVTKGVKSAYICVWLWGGGVAPPTQEMRWAVVWAEWPWGSCILGSFVGYCLWVSSGQSVLVWQCVLESQDSAVVGMVWPLPSVPAVSGPLRIFGTLLAATSVWHSLD